ncbi:hypothetical protein GUJ93_ZPchr0001g31943 [Zizania palustris]|uniref:Uncharacterized protein n=1 Tax=Zizania palustris TaxID=103762 RepID=A0A8J5SHE2_ZIZPA|nr:hypothetical protein GUJ93_ZPchr0001g31943 [Zizania palustris]
MEGYMQILDELDHWTVPLLVARWRHRGKAGQRECGTLELGGETVEGGQAPRPQAGPQDGRRRYAGKQLGTSKRLSEQRRCERPFSESVGGCGTTGPPPVHRLPRGRDTDELCFCQWHRAHEASQRPPRLNRPYKITCAAEALLESDAYMAPCPRVSRLDGRAVSRAYAHDGRCPAPAAWLTETEPAVTGRHNNKRA